MAALLLDKPKLPPAPTRVWWHCRLCAMRDYMHYARYMFCGADRDGPPLTQPRRRRSTMTARTTFEAAVASASATKSAAIDSAHQQSPATVNSALAAFNAGGSYATYAAAVAAADATHLAAIFAAEAARQALINAALATAQSTDPAPPSAETYKCRRRHSRRRDSERPARFAGPRTNRDRGSFAAPPLPHHRTYGSVYGGSAN
jgi:hypothetical protein